MELFYIFGIALGVVFLGALITTLVCFFMAFYVPEKDKLPREEYPIPKGKVYEPHRERMIRFIRETRELRCEDVCITSFDGLKLYGKFYEYAPGAPIELMMPGYRGLAERDLCGGAQRCFKLGRSVLLVDQRACGRCEGNVVTFGIKERYDCQSWANYLYSRFPESSVILTGISMGAATVMMATELPLPENVVGVIADCGYSSPKEIICKVIQQMNLPARPLYPFVRLAARLLGGFDLEAASPEEAMKHCTLPVFFAHGESDDFVPMEMTLACHRVCTAPKKLLTVPGAGHGLAYLIAHEKYIETLKEMVPLYAKYH